MLIRPRKQMFKNKPLLATLAYSMAGLVAIFILARFWLPSGYTLVGHDSGLPLDSKVFLESRLFAWNQNIGFGVDNSYLFGSLPLHFIDYLSSWIGNTFYAGNWFNLFFWTALIFLSAVLFAYHFKDIFNIYFVFIFPPLIIFNFYLSQSLFILERAKYSILAGTLIFLAILFKVLDKKVSIFIGAILASLTFFFLNGGSLLGVSLFGNLIVILLAILVFCIIDGISKKDFSSLRRLTLFFVVTFVIFLVLNSYQLLPYLPNILNKSYFVHLGVETVAQSKDWVNYISRDVSFLNLFRLQGVPTWYSQLGGANPQHPYAGVYLNNPLYILISFIFPILAFGSLILTKEKMQKKFVLLFLLVVLLAMPFAAGTHPPFGFLYGFLYDHVPGFFVFRNPYYKFAGGFFIGVCFLISATFSLIASRMRFKIVSYIVCFLVVLAWLGYHHNLLLPEKVFAWKPEFSTRMKIPDYVWDFNNWNKKENIDNKKILLVPSLGRGDLADGYTWGYWSLSPLTYTLASVPGLVNEGDLTREEKGWLDKIYVTLGTNNETEFLQLSSRLGVKFLLFRKDSTNLVGRESLEKSLTFFSSLQKIQSFDEWELYQINNIPESEIKALNSITLVQEGNNYIAREFLNNKSVVAQDFGLLEEDLTPFIDQKIRTYTCQSCLLERIQSFMNFPAVRVFSNSPFYFLKEKREKKSLESAKDDGGRIMIHLTNVFRRASEVKSMFILGVEDRYIIENVKTSNQYLDSVNQLLNKHPELATNYLMAKQALDIVNPLLNEFHRFVISNDFGRRPSEVRSVVYDEIKSLDEMNNYFSTLLHESNYLRNNKAYSLGKEQALYLDTSSLSKDSLGKLSLPIDVKLDTVKNSRWLKINLDPSFSAGSILNLRFDLPNIFQYLTKNLQSFPSGSQGCIYGRIANFQQGKSYEINVSVKSKAQRLALFNPNLDKLVDIYPIETSTPFRYIYEPDSKESDPSLMLCTDDRDFPEIGSLAVYEMISPNLLAVSDLPTNNNLNEVVTFKRINPTLYKVTIKDPNNSFILKFGERFSPLWRLYPTNSSWIKDFLDRKTKNNHITIDGYANAWILDPKGQTEWIIKYVPQEFFYIGSAITIISLILAGGIIIWKKLR